MKTLFIIALYLVALFILHLMDKASQPNTDSQDKTEMDNK